MNTYILILKGNNKDLAIAEFENLWNTYYNENIKLQILENVIYKFKTKYKLNKDNLLLKRLTYTNLITELIYLAKDFKDFEQNASELNFSQYNGKTFLVRCKKPKKEVKIPLTEAQLAQPIWNLMQNPQINLKNPDVEFNFIFTSQNNKIYICKKIFENKKDYLRRMPTKRPIKMPYTLKSDMARCIINLLNLKIGTILDPFCGIGGILLEAYDMNFQIIGNDISYNDLKYFKTNFDYFYPQSQYLRILADSQTQFLKNNSVDGIVTDIPYGKCSRRLGTQLYDKFLQNAQKMLKPNKKIIIIYANFCEFKSLALKYFSEIQEIKEYINKSMTRHILILENKK